MSSTDLPHSPYPPHPPYDGVHVAQFSFLPTGESRELTDDVRQLFEDLAAHLTHEQRAYSGECHPPLDVRETGEAVEVIVDVSGIAPDSIERAS
jgi:HSP20 family molecular chaperone IbpA